MLFAGVAGIGKLTLAQFIAKASNCVQLQNDFCNSCPSCQRISENAHPDVKSVAPDGQFIKIDQMRSVSREVFFKPFEGRRRVFIIDEAEKFRDESANSILKTLEEPPDTSILILVTSRPNDLLPTIRSRCQMYRFAPLLQRTSSVCSKDERPTPRRTTAAGPNRRWQPRQGADC
jgi:DNA polymerase-3 subunit delta'